MGRNYVLLTIQKFRYRSVIKKFGSTAIKLSVRERKASGVVGFNAYFSLLIIIIAGNCSGEGLAIHDVKGRLTRNHVNEYNVSRVTNGSCWVKTLDVRRLTGALRDGI